MNHIRRKFLDTIPHPFEYVSLSIDVFHLIPDHIILCLNAMINLLHSFDRLLIIPNYDLSSTRDLDKLILTID